MKKEGKNSLKPFQNVGGAKEVSIYSKITSNKKIALFNLNLWNFKIFLRKSKSQGQSNNTHGRQENFETGKDGEYITRNAQKDSPNDRGNEEPNKRKGDC